MRENKRIEKSLLFKNNIKDIVSISLDSDYKVDNNKVVGNFIISGEYKIHEVSINKEKFNFKIPFEIDIESDIDRDTINVEITNFIYDYQKDELIVNIEYSVIGDRRDVLLFEDEESLDDFLSNREVEVIDDRVEGVKDMIEKEDIEIIDNISVVEDNNLDRDNNIEKEEVIKNIGNPSDGFVTYKVYKIHENETLESLLVKYHTNLDDLKEYNDITNLNIGDKIIIPTYE